MIDKKYIFECKLAGKPVEVNANNADDELFFGWIKYLEDYKIWRRLSGDAGEHQLQYQADYPIIIHGLENIYTIDIGDIFTITMKML